MDNAIYRNGASFQLHIDYNNLITQNIYILKNWLNMIVSFIVLNFA